MVVLVGDLNATVGKSIREETCNASGNRLVSIKVDFVTSNEYSTGDMCKIILYTIRTFTIKHAYICLNAIAASPWRMQSNCSQTSRVLACVGH